MFLRLLPTVGFIAALVGFLAVAGCGGSQTGGGTSNAAITPAQRMASIDSITEKYAIAIKNDALTAPTAVLEAAQKDPLIADALLGEDGVVSLTFTDGVGMTVGSSRKPSASRVSSFSSRQLDPPTWLPKGTNVGVINSLADDRSMTTVASKIADGLQQGGYSLAGGRVLSGTYDEYVSLTKLGFLYIESHGTMHEKRLPDKSYRVFYGLFTAEPVNPQNLQRFDEMLKSENMMIASTSYIDSDGERQVKKVFTLTEKWLGSQRWFDDHAIAFLNTCHSGKPSIAQKMAATNIGLYLGWSKAVGDPYCTTVADRLFELMANTDGTRRSWKEAREILGNENLLSRPLRDGDGGERLVFTEGGTAADNLLPRIDSVTVDETTQEATVRGLFWEAPGVVLENGLASRPMSVKEWTNHSFKVQLRPSTFALQVKSGVRDTGLFYLKVWRVSSASGGPFRVNNRVKLVLADRNLTSFTTIVDESSGTAAGNKGPFYFHADITKRLAFLAYSDAATGGFDEVWLTTPDGRRKRLHEGIADGPVLGANGLINVMWGYSFLDRF